MHSSSPLVFVVCKTTTTPLSYPFDVDPESTLEKYLVFARICAEQNALLYIALSGSYLGNLRFAKGWRCEKGGLVEVAEAFTADAVYTIGKTHNLNHDIPNRIISHPQLEKIDDDKWLMYTLLKEYMPLTLPITQATWREVFAHLPGEKVVLKPVTGSSGEGVVITTKDAFTDADYPAGDRPYLAQEFIDTSKGIPGIAPGIHDLRLIFFNNQLKQSFIRLAAPDSLLSNYAQGASIEVVPLEKLPPLIQETAAAIDKKLAQYYPRVYTIDFMLHYGRPYLTEINTSPGLPHPALEGEQFTNDFFTYVVELLVSLTKKPIDKPATRAYIPVYAH